jgi:quercetin dioxygenase-like cupin family protein
MLSAAALADEHAIQSNALKWAAGPPSLSVGVQVSVLLGDPAKEGLYVIRLKLPAGYRIPVHTHPNYEHVTVISGAFHFGLGPKFDETRGTRLGLVGFAHAAQGHGALCVPGGDHRAGAGRGGAHRYGTILEIDLLSPRRNRHALTA